MQKKILIIDDDHSLLRLTQMILERHGYKSAIAPSSAKAKEKLQSDGRVDLIILDLMMPDEDGFSFLKWLEFKSGFDPEIPVILNTAKSLSDAEYEEFHKHCHKIILKGMNFTEILIAEVTAVFNECKLADL